MCVAESPSPVSTTDVTEMVFQAVQQFVDPCIVRYRDHHVCIVFAMRGTSGLRDYTFQVAGYGYRPLCSVVWFSEALDKEPYFVVNFCAS